MGECSRREESLGMFTGNTHRAREEGDAEGDEVGSVREAARGVAGQDGLRSGWEAKPWRLPSRALHDLP